MNTTIFALFLSQILNEFKDIYKKRRSTIERRKRKCKNEKVKGKNVKTNMKKILIRMKSRIEKEEMIRDKKSIIISNGHKWYKRRMFFLG